MAIRTRALVACCSCEGRQLLVRLLTSRGVIPFVVTSTAHAVSLLRSGSVFVAFCQESFHGNGWRVVLREATKAAVPVVICCPATGSRCQKDCLELGAFDFLRLPYDITDVSTLSHLSTSSPFEARL